MGVHKYHECQCLKGQREKKDIILYHHLERKFGRNKQNIIKCSQRYKYRYPKGKLTKVTFTLSKSKKEDPEAKANEHINEPPATAETPSTSTGTHGTTQKSLSFSGLPIPPKVEICLEKLVIKWLKILRET